ncbi:peptidase M23-like protein [Kineococcus xinjiangensis]|uniref:Peptidase M23-like protein n=1 Tax=Kineococcus xinjiangensis TaxID=512762 RepID=A0A2S6IG22_9ACTN|nr:M23 family metallopeptidase [Kineococcus xinjiangensis]PPK93158.1 peptidase M23-like protein [Kineococcus xinjiangensis]
MKLLAALLVVLLLPFGAVVGFTAVLTMSAARGDAGGALCGPTGPGVVVDLSTLPPGNVGAYDRKQLENAALIMNAAKQLGLDQRAQTIGVMTAIGESTLRVLDHGDEVGPDSRGLFQQRDDGAWGSYSDRMNPTISATNFFEALVQVRGWQTLPPTLAAHRTQRNKDPFHYAKHWNDAVRIVQALSGTVVVPGEVAVNGSPECTTSSVSSPSEQGWTRPSSGPVTSDYGPRPPPAPGASSFHKGTDLGGGGCNGPIYAAAGGVVVRSGPASGFGNAIVIDHGGDVVTWYGHMYTKDLLVRVGEQVSAGQQIARVGANGVGSGCHLHFEVHLRDTKVDPEPFMAQRGAPLG